MLIILGIILVIIFGFLLSLALVENMRFIERVGISFLLGLGIFTFLMFCYSTLGIKITLTTTLTALIFFNLLAYLLTRILHRRIYLKIPIVELFKSLSPLEKIFVAIVGVLGITSIIITTYYPVNAWDAFALYDFRAKVIFETGYFTQIARNFSYFSSYPLFTSLSHTLVYIFGGKNPQFIYSLLYISFLFAFYGALRKFVTREISLIATALLASTPVIFEHSTVAYTNLPYAIFISLGTIYLYIWMAKERKNGYLILAALMTGLSTWSRSAEPFWAANLFMVISYSLYRYWKHRDSILSPIWYSIVFFPMKEVWNKINYEVQTGTVKTISLIGSELGGYGVAFFGTRIDFVRMLEVIAYVYKNIVSTWYPVAILFLLCLVFGLKNLKKNNSIFLIFIFLHFGLLVYGTYLFSFSYPYWVSIPDSARRLAMFFLPLMIYYVGLSAGELTAKIR